jgi:hypothetical protein
MVEYSFIHIPKNAGMSFQKALAGKPNIIYRGHGVQFWWLDKTKNIYVVRNPVDRFTSAFFYLKRYEKNKMRDHLNNPEQLIQSLLEFDARALSYMKIQDHYHSINGKPVHTDWVFAKQILWVYKPYKFLLFDDLEQEIEKLNEETGLNIKIPKINASPRVPFEYSERSIEYLKCMYKEDFELYNAVKEDSNKAVLTYSMTDSK